MALIHSPVDVHQFAEFREKRPVTVREMIKNILKRSFCNAEESGKMIRNPFLCIESPPKLNRFFTLVVPIISVNFNEIG